jgi:uncharacterized membrane protein
MAEALERMGGRDQADPEVRTITIDDLRAALRKGVDDFMDLRSDVLFIVLIYPVIGVALATFAFNARLAPYIFPMASGFALLGPVLATGLYEMSRRREAGQEVHWTHAFDPIRSPSFGPILGLGIYLLGIFLLWIVTAGVIFRLTMGATPPESAVAFFGEVLTTGSGLALFLIGVPVGAVFAAVVLAVAVVSFPLLVDRNIGLPRAVVTSLRVSRENPRTVAVWGLTVAAILVAGSIPLFLGLIVALPILGHASWHLYRRAVVPR